MKKLKAEEKKATKPQEAPKQSNPRLWAPFPVEFGPGKQFAVKFGMQAYAGHDALVMDERGNAYLCRSNGALSDEVKDSYELEPVTIGESIRWWATLGMLVREWHGGEVFYAWLLQVANTLEAVEDEDFAAAPGLRPALKQKIRALARTEGKSVKAVMEEALRRELPMKEAV